MSFNNTPNDLTLSESNSEFAIRVKGLSKCYQIYDNPANRLKQFVIPRIKHILKISSQNYFTEFWALKDISFEIKKGETIGIIGKNGSGKSTLLQIICGTLHPSVGQIEVNGRVAALLELGSGFNPEFTGRENVFLNASILGLSYQQTLSRFSQIQKFADIGDFIDQPVKTYSSGMMVRLAFAVAIHVDANILIIDEALAVGDVFFQQKCMRFLSSFKDNGGTILFVSHDTAAVTGICNKAILLSRSMQTQYAIGNTDEICRLYLSEIYADRVNLNQESSTESLFLENSNHVLEIPSDDVDIENEIRFSPFSQFAESFGVGAAEIIDVWFKCSNHKKLSEARGGEPVVLCVEIRANKEVTNPVVGFMLKDRLGQFIFAEGTDLFFRKKNIMLKNDQRLVVEFSFLMPILIQGEYALNVAVAEGHGDNHIQQHWIYDALVIHSTRSRLVHGVTGLQNLEMKIMISDITAGAME